MNAGKSTILLQSSHNYIERGMHTLLLKPVIDNRDDCGALITSRIGLSATANLFSQDEDLDAYIGAAYLEKKLDCVLIDEAQFLTPEQVWQLAAAADAHKLPVMCYGLRTDFQGQLFPGSATLLAIADDVREIRTLCWCGKKATMNLRVDGSGTAVTEGEQIEIGGDDMYVSLCRKHWRVQAVSG